MAIFNEHDSFTFPRISPQSFASRYHDSIIPRVVKFKGRTTLLHLGKLNKNMPHQFI